MNSFSLLPSLLLKTLQSTFKASQWENMVDRATTATKFTLSDRTIAIAFHYTNLSILFTNLSTLMDICLHCLAWSYCASFTAQAPPQWNIDIFFYFCSLLSSSPWRISPESCTCCTSHYSDDILISLSSLIWQWQFLSLFIPLWIRSLEGYF